VNTIPRLTLALLASLLVAYCATGAAELLVYDRAAILQGQWWRLATGHWVHFSHAHLLCNVLVIAAAGSLIEMTRRGDFALLCALAILPAGPALLLAEPGLVQFGGASGVACALVVYAALSGLTTPGRWRVVCALLLGAVGLKLLVEWGAGWSLSAGVGQRDFVPVPLSHLVGAGAAFGLWLWRGRPVRFASVT
jgi:rhomboid family GlyGly-CTERM serine protease